MIATRSRSSNIAETDKLPAVSARTAFDGTIQFIRSLIHSGELGPGDRLPSERDLAIQLGISRLTLRLALKALEVNGYVTSRRGTSGGTFVSELPILLERWTEWMRNNREEIDDILDFRIAIECEIASLASQRRTDQDLEQMELAIQSLENTRTTFQRADADFHKALARAAGNSRLDQAMRVARGEVFLPVDKVIRDDGVGDTETGHRAVLNAVRDRDAARAVDAMRAHIMYTRTALFNEAFGSNSE